MFSDNALAALKQQFWQQGYLVLEDVFATALMDRMQKQIIAHYGASPAFEHNDEFLQKAATEVVPWFPQRDAPEKSACFDELEQLPALNALTEMILGENWQALYCMTMYSRPHTKGQAWHQDCPPEDPNQFNLNRLVYTMDITEATGGQVLIKPGSHKLGELTAGDVDEDFGDQVMLAPRKGTLVIIHGHTWHRVMPIGSEHRVSTNFRAMPVNTQEEITDICVYRNMRYRFSTNEVIECRGNDQQR